MAAASRKGVVACSTTTTSARSPRCSISRTACAITGFRLGMSPARSPGRRNGTSAPQERATSATCGSSVDTIKRSMDAAAFAACSVCASSGQSPSRLMFR